ncbi:MAG: SAM-dependent methyltransferase [Pseudomonadota bacterium]|nr:SAM-dependent methyltransferase [Pseudomonadota bacterium]MDO7710285.1 SAM-dependent methyltransferase [Pseudomonadota bacterium]
MTLTTSLTVTDTIAQQHSEQLMTLIKLKISEAGGKISFADYMQLCLYAPGLGYYSAGSHKIGYGGDFTTAPEISPLFSRSLAHQLIDVLRQLDQGNILEFGAGSGKMAVDILRELYLKQSLPQQYYIIEASADLRQRQQQTIHHAIPHLEYKVVWLDSLPSDFNGVVLANEVCDAMPVHRLHFTNGLNYELYIVNNNDELQWCDEEISRSDLIDKIIEIKSFIDDTDYFTEVNLAAQAWLTSLADNLQHGAIFVIDYGYPQAIYYHPQRSNGTLMCYYQQQGHDNPLILPGLQDITAHVDFTSLAQIAVDNGLDVAGFQSQADFLLAAGITELTSFNEHDDAFLMLQHATEIKRLTLPTEMGETFKVLTLTKNLDHLLPRIQLGDRRYNL